MIWLVLCLTPIVLIAFLAWALCRISGDSDERAERIYQAWVRRQS